MIVSLCKFIKPEDILTNVSAKSLCSFKAGGHLEYFICPKTLNDFLTYLKALDIAGISYKVVGNMSNILPCDGLNKGVYITTRYITDSPSCFGNSITAYCGDSVPELCYKTAKIGLSGLEGLCSIPATIGGAIYNNAGAFGYCISNALQSMLIYSKGRVVSVSADYAKFDYRSSNFQKNNDIVLSATFKLESKPSQEILADIHNFTSKRKSTQPAFPSAGCVFKNLQNLSAGYLIDQSGLKGLTIGGAQISTQHANFIVNIGGATSQDIKQLINLAQTKVKQKFNISLQKEIEFIGENNENISGLSYP